MTLYIAGAGGFGRETLDALRAAGAGRGGVGADSGGVTFLDDHPAAAEVCGVPVCRPDQATAGAFVVAIANPQVRRRMAGALLGRGLAPAQVVHPRAVVSAGAAIGPGCVILANAFVSTGAVLGAHVHVNYNATVGHDTVAGDYVTVLPGANVAGTVMLGPDVTVGSNACVLPGLRVGSGVTVGAGAVVTRDQPDGVVVVGVPARPLRAAGTQA